MVFLEFVENVAGHTVYENNAFYAKLNLFSLLEIVECAYANITAGYLLTTTRFFSKIKKKKKKTRLYVDSSGYKPTINLKYKP